MQIIKKIQKKKVSLRIFILNESFFHQISNFLKKKSHLEYILTLILDHFLKNR